jgi:hypothetical protein
METFGPLINNNSTVRDRRYSPYVILSVQGFPANRQTVFGLCFRKTVFEQGFERFTFTRAPCFSST